MMKRKTVDRTLVRENRIDMLKDTGEGRNECNDNPAQETETSSGACTTARKASISSDIVLEMGCRVIYQHHLITRINLR